MTSILDKLNLRTGERRLVVFVALAVFVALNLVFVRPQFGMVTFWNNRKDTAEKKLSNFQGEIARRPVYDKTLKSLEVLGGQIPADEQALQLQRDVISLAALTGVSIDSSSPVQKQGAAGRTNAFFEEQTMNISVTTGEGELVDFLYGLGRRNSMIRARTMNLGPDPTRMKLKGQIALVASYQKKPPPRTVATIAGAKPPASKPATMVPKTNAAKTVAVPGRTNPPQTSRTNTGVISKPPAAKPPPSSTSIKPSRPATIAATGTNAALKPGMPSNK